MKPETDLILLLKQGDEKAFESIFNRFFDELCLFAKSITKNREVAEDLVEDIFLHLWVNCHSHPVKVSVKSYLYQSTYNNAIKYVSRKKIHISLSDDEKQIQDKENPFEFQSGDYTTDHIVAEELGEKVEQAIKSLPEQCRTIYLLNRDEDLNYRQIAEKLTISESTVKTQMGRAFVKLRDNLKEFFSIML